MPGPAAAAAAAAAAALPVAAPAPAATVDCNEEFFQDSLMVGNLCESPTWETASSSASTTCESEITFRESGGTQSFSCKISFSAPAPAPSPALPLANTDNCAIKYKRINYVEDSSDVGDDVNLAPLAPRRKRHRVSQFPRILKRDIRRDLSFMLANALNSANRDFLSSFLFQFCVSSCRSVDYSHSGDISKKVPIKNVVGVENIVHRVGSELELIPDFLYRVKETQIEQRLDTPGSKVVAQVRVQGTKLHEAWVRYTDEAGAVRTVPHIVYDAMVALGQIDPARSATTEICLRNSPFVVDVQGINTLMLDNDHRIYRMEFVADCLLPLDF